MLLYVDVENESAGLKRQRTVQASSRNVIKRRLQQRQRLLDEAGDVGDDTDGFGAGEQAAIAGDGGAGPAASGAGVEASEYGADGSQTLESAPVSKVSGCVTDLRLPGIPCSDPTLSPSHSLAGNGTADYCETQE